jgi:hypothetical protein
MIELHDGLAPTLWRRALFGQPFEPNRAEIVEHRVSNDVGRGYTTLHHNTHLLMSLKEGEFVDRDAVPWSNLPSAPHVVQSRSPLIHQDRRG